MSYQYRQISNFGPPKNDCSKPECKTDDSHPLTMCLADTMDKSFQNGGIAHLYGPRSQKCQLYMSERCANKWDGFCEYFYRENTPQGMAGQWPDSQNWPDTAQTRNWEYAYGLDVPLSTGEQLLKNTAERKYCTYLNCEKHCEPFNPTDPDSPMITYYTDQSSYGSSCVPVCRVNPSTVDVDPVMDRMLQNPKAAASTLINICNTAKREGTNLSGTRLGAVCDNYLRIRSSQQRR